MNIRVYARAIFLLTVTGTSACVTHPPTIAHVHIGHALTGVHVTPGHKGYMLVAEQRADETLAAVKSAGLAPDLPGLKSQIALAVSDNDNQENFGVKQALVMAANHIAFAATSTDASENVVRFAPAFKSDIAAVIGRCEYIDLLAKDVAASSSMGEASLLVQEILKAAQANVDGNDSNGGGAKGSAPAEYGMAQLRAELQLMIGRENPPYRTVDDWYLFNLVRLPSGRWVFDRLGRGGTIDGYK
ncbi:MAG: hypothetical protein NVS9B2_12650 [Steroidobacteraceae bacterium]